MFITMTWKHIISYVCFALTTASAYRQIYNNPGYYFTGSPQPTIERRADVRSVDSYSYRSDRPSERSIPFSGSSQRVQAQEWGRIDAPEPRHGNLTIKTAFTKTYPSVSSRRDKQQPWLPKVERRADVRSVDFYSYRSDRHSERSIPFSGSSQRVQAQEWGRIDAPEPRHGNLTVKTAFTKTYPSVTSRRGSPVDPDSVVFPGPTSRRSMFEPEVPSDCELRGICETVPNYPHEYVNNLLAKMDDLSNRFNLDVETPEIAQRRGPGEESLELCEHTETIIYPRAAKNTQGKWVFIVNKDSEPVQGFKGELCVNIDKSCSEIAYFSDKYKATCQQKRVERAMWSIDKNGNMIKESIPMPSCCTCIVKVVT